MRWCVLGVLAVGVVAAGCTGAAARTPDPGNGALNGGGAFADGHARPRALAVDARGDLLYVALSTANRLAVIDVRAGAARVVADVPVCAFPDALAPLPGGGVVVGCRFDPGLRVVGRAGQGAASRGDFPVRVVDTGPEHGNRGLAVDRAGRFAYVGSPPRGGVKVVDLMGASGAPLRFIATGAHPQTVRLLESAPPRLLVSNFIDHTVTIHAVAADGGLSAAQQTIRTEAPVLDMGVLSSHAGGGDLRGALLLATHEDRPLSRERIVVEGLDSVVLALAPSVPPYAAGPFIDPGVGKRTTINLTERARDPLVGLDALAVDAHSGRLAVAGAGSDNLLVGGPNTPSLLEGRAVTVGANPSAVAFLPDGRVATADRLSDTVSLVSAAGACQSV
ncbi:MAG: hypothetical protein ABUR63_09055, partial [Verrucomicrobiota bacterium]